MCDCFGEFCRKRRVKVARKCSGDLLTSPPPAEKATARQDQVQHRRLGRERQDIGRKLLQSVGLANPSVADIALAIEANDQFIAELERIHATAQGTIIDQ